MEEKTNKKQFKIFCKEYLENECEKQVLKIRVLSTYDNRAGAAKSQGSDYWSSTIKTIAFINKDNEVELKDMNFYYYLNNTNPLKFIDYDALTAYDIKCKKIKNTSFYQLIKIKKVRDKRFATLIEDIKKPITKTIGGVVFKYNRPSSYDGEFMLKRNTVSVSLMTSRDDQLDASESIDSYMEITKNFKRFYTKILNRCAKELVVLANEWRADDDDHEITSEEIVGRISKQDFYITVRGKEFSFDFDDDDIFCGHFITYSGDLEDDEFTVNING